MLTLKERAPWGESKSEREFFFMPLDVIQMRPLKQEREQEQGQSDTESECTKHSLSLGFAWKLSCTS